MYTQRFRNLSEFIQPALNDFLNRINYNNIYLLPCDNNAQIFAVQSRYRGRIRRLTGKCLMKRNVRREAHRLQIYNRYLINLATDQIWSLHSTFSQRNRFVNLANNANSLNQIRVQRVRRTNSSNTPNTLDRIAQITAPQITNNPFEDNIFNGTNFDNNNGFESLILPAGCLRPSSFV
jgi:hypothetical protein